MKKKAKSLCLGLRAKGSFAWEILEAGKVVRNGRIRNLVTDYGLDGISSRSWEGSMEYCAVGTGTKPMHVASGTTEASRSGNTVTADGSIFLEEYEGAVIQWDSGASDYIASFIDGETVETVGSGAVSSGKFTIHRVDLNTLGAEVKRSNTHVVGSSNCGSTYNATTKANTLFRTFIFSTESEAVTYNEIGVSYSGSSGSNLFARAIISGGVSLAAGQQLRVKYALTITLANENTSEAVVVGITGIENQNATQMAYLRGLREIESDGDSNPGYCSSALEPSVSKEIAVFKNPPGGGGGGFRPFDDKVESYAYSGGNVASGTAVKSSYSNGDHYADFSYTFTTGQGNGDIEWISFGGTSYCALLIQMAEPFTKTSDDTLTLNFRLSWGRDLVN